MRRVHIGLNLKDKTGELLIISSNQPLRGLTRLRRRCHADITFQEVLYAEVGHS